MSNYLGNLDYIEGRTIVGWVIDKDRPEEILEVEVVSEDGAVLSNGLACFSRQDVLAAGVARETCGFRLEVDPEIIAQREIHLRVVEKYHDFYRQPAIKLAVDVANRARVAGWTQAVISSKPLNVALSINGVPFSSQKADMPRPDVLAAGYMRSDCGFEFDLREANLTDEGYATLSVRTEDQSIGRWNVKIQNTAVSGHIDQHSGRLVMGWAENLDVKGPCHVEVVINEKVVASSKAEIFREDRAHLGQERAICGFHIVIPEGIELKENEIVIVREVESKCSISGSPFYYEKDKFNEDYLAYFRKDKSLVERFRRRMYIRHDLAAISIVMPVYNTPSEWLNQAINSVVDQWSPKWELICVDDCSSETATLKCLQMHEQADPRIKLIRLGANMGIASATNAGIDAASNDIILFMDHDDFLEPNAVYQFSQAFKNDKIDLCYSDEVITSEDISVFISLKARPDFSYDYYLSHPYFVHAIAFRKAIAQEIGGLDENMKISADVDFVLRFLERSRSVGHIAFPLYRWRTHSASAGHQKKGAVIEATLGALARSLDRIHPGCKVEPGFNFNEYKVSWPKPDAKVLIVIPSKNNFLMLQKAIQSIHKTLKIEDTKVVVVDHDSQDAKTIDYLQEIRDMGVIVETYRGKFNFSAMNNIAVERNSEGCRCVTFMNDDVEAIDENWMGRLLSLSCRRDVGAVSPLLLFPDMRVQHAGVILGFNGIAEHVQKFANPYHNKTRASGFNAILTSCREYSAVTAACLTLEISKFREVRGFDEKLTNAFNDVDLCLRLKRAGYKTIYDGFTRLIHHESATRSKIPGMLKHPLDTEFFLKRWQSFIDDGDPFYNHLLALSGEDHVPAPFRPSTHSRDPQIAAPLIGKLR